eukprot:Sro318_g115860.1 n/a (179) ;mRNA; r:10194-10730
MRGSLSSGNSSRSRDSQSLEGSIVNAIVPRKGDWRSEYEDYLSLTRSVTRSVENSDKRNTIPRSRSNEDIARTKKGSLRRVMKMTCCREGKKPSFDDHHLDQSSFVGVDDILSDLESMSPLMKGGSAKNNVPRGHGSGSGNLKPLVKVTSSQSTGPVVSESTVENSDVGSVYLVRVRL